MVIISMLQKKFVEELKWIGQEEVMDLVAIAQSCPGVMAVNTSIIIGYRIAGVFGALLTVVGDGAAADDHSNDHFRLLCSVPQQSDRGSHFKGNAGGSGGGDDQCYDHHVGNVLEKKEALSAVMLAAAAVAILLFDVDVILVILICGLISGFVTVGKLRKGAAK